MQKLAGGRRKFGSNHLREYGKTRTPCLNSAFYLLTSAFLRGQGMFNTSELVSGTA